MTMGVPDSTQGNPPRPALINSEGYRRALFPQRARSQGEGQIPLRFLASRKGYRIESVPITTVYTDQVSKIHPLRDALRFFKMMRRYRKL
jgi:hypothetical protein